MRRVLALALWFGCLGPVGVANAQGAEPSDAESPVSAPAEEPSAPAESATPRAERPRAGLGLNPGTPKVGDLIVPTHSERTGAGVAEDGFRLSYHGFLRIPTRIGLGSDDDVAAGVEEGTKIHSPPRIPDADYIDWRYTNTMGGPWSELWFSYGNGTVTANVVLAAYDVTDGSFKDLLSQLGVNQSFLTIQLPRLLGDKGGVVWNVGAFAGRYGAAGRYDAGKYDTYLFGATHTAGETLTAFWDLSDRLTLHLEHGLGAKLRVTPRVKGVQDLGAPYLPYGGEEQQGSTLLHHAHAGLTVDEKLTFGLHYLTSFTDDARLADEKDGSLSSMGAEIKLTDTRYGDGYLGFGHLRSETPQRVAGALEVLHTFEGWNLVDNYFPDTDGSGTVNSVLFQHTFSLAKYLWHPKEYWGQASDLLISVFGMYNHITSDDDAFMGAKDKLKMGAEVTYTPKPWLGVSGRYDLVQPNLDDKHESFHVLSPKLILRTDYVSHEEIVLSYARYVYGDKVRTSNPNNYAEQLLPDENVFRLAAIMWW
jgi:hypothetical protein